MNKSQPMMILKKTTLYIIVIINTLFTTSCESWLDREPITTYSSDNFWHEPAQADAVLMAAYYGLQNALNTEFVYYGEARADNFDAKLYNAGTYALVNNTLNADLSFTDWANFYSVIKQANLIIKNVEEMKLKGLYANKTADYNRVMGQALGLRALSYLYMTKVWGNVPLITVPLEHNGDINSFKTERTDSLQVYQQISTDLHLARNLLPVSYSKQDYTRATLTKGAIDAIMTDYYMWRNNLDSALVTSNRILTNTNQYRLATLYNADIDYFSATQPQSTIDNTEYAQMFIEGLSPESIFEMAFSFEENRNSGLASLYGSGTTQVFFYASVNLISKFSSTDLRVKTNFKSENQIFKMFPKGSYDRAKEDDKNIILYRLADIILWRAEALTLTGSRAAAWTLLKRIRERVFGPPSSTNNYNHPITGPTGTATETQFKAMSISDAHDLILEERRKELCFEGKRWFDLVRTGKAIETLSPINGLNEKENILFPISLNVLRQNSKIEQNEFYK